MRWRFSREEARFGSAPHDTERSAGGTRYPPPGESVMNHEELVIRAFYERKRQERLIAQLQQPKRREETVRYLLSHGHDLDPRYVTWLHRSTRPIPLLLAAGSPKKVAVVFADTPRQGQVLLLEEALESPCCMIVSCIPGRLAYYRAEEGALNGILQRKDAPP